MTIHKKLCTCGFLAIATSRKAATENIAAHCAYREEQKLEPVCRSCDAKDV